MNEQKVGSADLERRFAGLARLYGLSGLKRIRSAHVVVVGIGGVGSWSAEALARSGVARLTLIDLDHVAESNINRQVHALDTTVGQAKVQAMRERIKHINPECHVHCVEEFVDAENWPSVFVHNIQGDSTTSTAFIDACDQVPAKILLAAWAVKSGATFITVGAAGGKRFAHRADIDDLSGVTHDPLLAKIRSRLRREHGLARIGKMKIPCVFSRESVAEPSILINNLDFSKDLINGENQFDPLPESTDGSLNCHGYGSTVSVTSTFGMCAAGWILNKIAAQIRKEI